MTKLVAVLLSLTITIQLCQSLAVYTSLTLPLGSTTESLQTGCVDNNHNKGYSILNTTSGASLIRFTLNPLSFQPEDYVFAKVSITKSNGALLDPRTQILYLYGYNDLGTAFGTIAAIESFDVANGTNLNPLTSYVTLATDTAGFLSAFVRVSLGHVFTITTTNNSTTLYELDLQSSGPAEVIHQQALEAPVAGVNYAYHTAVVLQSADSSDSPQVQTDYIFGTTGTTPANTAKLEVPETLPAQVAARLKGMKKQMHFNSQRETLNYDSPSVAGYSSAYPWPPTTSTVLTANTTLFSLASCKNSTDLIGLLATCDQDTGLCSSFSVISLSHSLTLSESIFLGNYNDVEPVTTLTCVPGQNIVLVTLGTTFYKVNMESSQVDKLALPTYKDLIWVGSDADGEYAYVGAEVYPNSSTGSVILQIQL